MNATVLCQLEPVLEIDGVKYHHHPNGGGLVAETAIVAPTAFVELDARVNGRAQVLDEARVEDRASISGLARVTARARICGSSVVGDNALISGIIEIHDLVVGGDTQISGSGVVYWSTNGFIVPPDARSTRRPRSMQECCQGISPADTCD